jgi:hypothetical protein
MTGNRDGGYRGAKIFTFSSLFVYLLSVANCYNPFEIQIAAACFLWFPTIRARRVFIEENYPCLSPMSAQKPLN